MDCGGRAIEGEQLTFVAALRPPSPKSNASYLWTLHHMGPRNNWQKALGFSANPSEGSLTITVDNLKEDTPYRVDVSTMVGVNDTRTSTYNFTTNGAPKGGKCWPDKEEGRALQTEFTFQCEYWTDVDQPLKYEFSYKTASGLNILLPSSNNSWFHTKLGSGNPSNGDRIAVTVFISDSHGATATTSFTVKVVKDLYLKFACIIRTQICKHTGTHACARTQAYERRTDVELKNARSRNTACNMEPSEVNPLLSANYRL